MSEPGGVSRRQLLESLMACASPFSAARATGEGVLENASIESRVRTGAGIRLKETDSKLLHAIENALTRIRLERFGICEGCG